MPQETETYSPTPQQQKSWGMSVTALLMGTKPSPQTMNGLAQATSKDAVLTQQLDTLDGQVNRTDQLFDQLGQKQQANDSYRKKLEELKTADAKSKDAMMELAINGAETALPLAVNAVIPGSAPFVSVAVSYGETARQMAKGVGKLKQDPQNGNQVLNEVAKQGSMQFANIGATALGMSKAANSIATYSIAQSILDVHGAMQTLDGAEQEVEKAAAELGDEKIAQADQKRSTRKEQAKTTMELSHEAPDMFIDDTSRMVLAQQALTQSTVADKDWMKNVTTISDEIAETVEQKKHDLATQKAVLQEQTKTLAQAREENEKKLAELQQTAKNETTDGLLTPVKKWFGKPADAPLFSRTVAEGPKLRPVPPKEPALQKKPTPTPAVEPPQKPDYGAEQHFFSSSS
jgi:hypothetical protein